MKKKSNLNKFMTSMVKWCGSYTKFAAMAMIVCVGVMTIMLSLFGAGHVVIITSLLLIPVLAMILGAIVS